MGAKEPPRRRNSLADRDAVAESAIDKAVRRGDFDNLPGMGKPLKGLHSSEDPDWWIKQKLDAEDISGVAPAAFQLRKESAVLEDTLDAFAKESDVRDYLTGFNARVREAVLDLRTGPPVFTPPRDIDAEVVSWRQRRTALRAAAEAAAADSAAAEDPAPAEEHIDPDQPGRRRPRWWRLRRKR